MNSVKKKKVGVENNIRKKKGENKFTKGPWCVLENACSLFMPKKISEILKTF